jgi:hypothetical protein
MARPFALTASLDKNERRRGTDSGVVSISVGRALPVDVVSDGFLVLSSWRSLTRLSRRTSFHLVVGGEESGLDSREAIGSEGLDDFFVRREDGVKETKDAKTFAVLDTLDELGQGAAGPVHSEEIVKGFDLFVRGHRNVTREERRGVRSGSDASGRREALKTIKSPKELEELRPVLLRDVGASAAEVELIEHDRGDSGLNNVDACTSPARKRGLEDDGGGLELLTSIVFVLNSANES